MMLPNLLPFMAGALAFGFAMCGVGFVRLWVRSRDRLFLAFAGAFWLLMVPSFTVLADIPEELKAWVYLARIVAYSLIIVSVVVRNRKRLRGSR